MQEEVKEQQNAWEQLLEDNQRLKLEMQYMKEHILNENQKKELEAIISISDKIQTVKQSS